MGCETPSTNPLIMQCKETIAQGDWEIKISHWYKEANEVADRLANLGITRDVGVVYFNMPPQEAIDVLNADAVGAVGPDRKSVV